MATKIVGLDLGTHSVKVCELVSTFRNYELVGFGSEPVGAPADETPTLVQIAEAAQRLIERRGLKNETIICALPPSMVSSVTLDFPFDKPKQIAATLPFELDAVIPFDVEDVVHDYQIIETREDGTTRVLASYVREETLSLFIDVLAAVDIDPKIVSVGSLAWFNLYETVLGESTEAVAVLDMGHTHSELCIFDEAAPSSIRDIPTGGRQVTAALAEVFKVEGDQAERGKLSEGVIVGGQTETLIQGQSDAPSRQQLISDTCRNAMWPVVREVRRSLAAHSVQAGHGVSRVLLTGGAAQLRGLDGWLQEQLGVPVQHLDPLQGSFNKLAEGGDRLRPYAGRALALGLRTVQRSSALNFRKGEHAYTGDFGFLRGRLISLAVSVVLIIALGALVAISKKQVLEAKKQNLLDQSAALSVEIFGRDACTESTECKAGFECIEDVCIADADTLIATVGAEAKQEGTIPEVSAFEVLNDLSRKIDFKLKVDVDQLEIDMSRKKMSLRGRTDSGGDVERLVDSIKNTQCFKNRVNKERVEKAMDDRTKFRLSASSTCI
jgi:type IV pilus assembly protein PilM